MRAIAVHFRCRPYTSSLAARVTSHLATCDRRAPTSTQIAGARTIRVNRLLNGIGAIFLLLGIACAWVSRLPFGRPPGNIHIERDRGGLSLPGCYQPANLSGAISLHLSWWQF